MEMFKDLTDVGVGTLQCLISVHMEDQGQKLQALNAHFQLAVLTEPSPLLQATPLAFHGLFPLCSLWGGGESFVF